jgi:hypothetical protein
MSDLGELKAGAAQAPAPGLQQQEMNEAFHHGLELGREWVRKASVKMAAWAEENPGQMVLAGLAAGFVFGKIFLRPRKRLEDDAE